MKHPLLRLSTAVSLLATVIILAGIGWYSGVFGGSDKAEATAPAEVTGTAMVTTTDATQGELSPIATAYGTVISSPQNSFVIQIPRDGARRMRTRTRGIRTAAVAIRFSSCKPPQLRTDFGE